MNQIKLCVCVCTFMSLWVQVLWRPEVSFGLLLLLLTTLFFVPERVCHWSGPYLVN